MDVKAFKISGVNIVSKITLTRTEAIALCKKGKHKVRKEFLKKIVKKLLEIDNVGEVVGEDHIPLQTLDINLSELHKESKI